MLRIALQAGTQHPTDQGESIFSVLQDADKSKSPVMMNMLSDIISCSRGRKTADEFFRVSSGDVHGLTTAATFESGPTFSQSQNNSGVMYIWTLKLIVGYWILNCRRGLPLSLRRTFTQQHPYCKKSLMTDGLSYPEQKGMLPFFNSKSEEYQGG